MYMYVTENKETILKVHLPSTMSIAFASFKHLKLSISIARVFVLQNRVSCAFPSRCTCVEFQLRVKRESTYSKTHELFIKRPQTRFNDKICVFFFSQSNRYVKTQ